MWRLLSCASILWPLQISQDQLFCLGNIFLAGIIEFYLVPWLNSSVCWHAVSYHLRNSENETHSHHMIQPLNSLVPWTQVSRMLTSNAYISLYRTLMAALFLTGRTRKQRRCPSGGEGTRRLGFIHAAGCSPVLKSHERDGVMGRQVGSLQCILFIKRSQSGKRPSSGYQLPRTFPKKASDEKGEKTSA